MTGLRAIELMLSGIVGWLDHLHPGEGGCVNVRCDCYSVLFSGMLSPTWSLLAERAAEVSTQRTNKHPTLIVVERVALAATIQETSV